MLNSLASGKWVRVRSGVGTNKTRTAAGIVLWFLECFPGAYVITTAPKEDQLLSQIWAEINTLYPKFGKGTLLAGGLRMEPNPNSKWKAEAFVAGIKASEESTSRAQGFHAEHMLVVIEETPGVPKPVLTALMNTSVGRHNLILALGNPDNQLDNFSEFNNLPNVVDVQISCFDHPNIVLNDPDFIPGAQTRDGIERYRIKYGEDQPLFLSRARGIAPAGSADSLIKYEWIEAAVERFSKLRVAHERHEAISGVKGQEVVSGDCRAELPLSSQFVQEYNITHHASNDYSFGVDVANSEGGDKASICEGRGRVCLKVNDFPCPDSNQLGHRLAVMMKELGVSGAKVSIDGIGVSAGTVNTLKEYGYDGKEISFIGSETPIQLDDSIEQYNNKRSQAWWLTKEEFRLGLLAIPDDKELITELITPKWSLEGGKICVEGKDEIKRRLGFSPNKADSFVYWVWNLYKESRDLKMFIRRRRW